MSQAERGLQIAIADACLGEQGGRAIATDLRAFLECRGVAAEDVEAILAAPPRLAVYRSLVRNGLSAVVLRMLPRTRARMNAACEGRFDADLARFVDEVGPRTHYLRDFPAELVEWAEPRWRADTRVPEYLSDLAAHELAFFAVAASPETPGPPPELGEVDIDLSLVFASSARLLRYAWAVHELPADPDAGGEPQRRDVHLLAYRDPEHAVRWLELTPLAASIVARLVRGERVRDAVDRACEDHDTSAAAVLDDIARLLADLGARNVVLGARGHHEEI
jgi:hypothetical protein